MIVLDRTRALDLYYRATVAGRAIPCFGAENRISVHAALETTRRVSDRIGEALPVIIAATVNYAPRPQARHYSLVDDWQLGLRLFLADLEALAGPGGPYESLPVISHLDHVCPPVDADLLASDMPGRFTSVLFDASHLPLDANAVATRKFCQIWGDRMVIEAACDELVEYSSGEEHAGIRTPDEVRWFVETSGCDMFQQRAGTL